MCSRCSTSDVPDPGREDHWAGLGRRRVAKAVGIARLDEGTSAAVTVADLTLDQAAAVAVYADDEATTAALIQAAGRGRVGSPTP